MPANRSENDRRLEAARQKLDYLYMAKRNPGPSERRELWGARESRPLNVEIFWGVGEKYHMTSGWKSLRILGVMGRYYWPVFCALKLSSSHAIPAKSFASVIATYIPKGALSGKTAAETLRHIECLLLTSRQVFPPPTSDDALVAALLQAAYELDARFEPSIVKAALSPLTILSPGDALSALVDAIPGILVTTPQLASSTHANVPIEIERMSPRHIGLADDVQRNMSAKKPQLQIIVGDCNEGKSTITTHLLRRWGFEKREPRRRYLSSTGLHLPVFAISCRDLTYFQIIEEVYRFLVVGQRGKTCADPSHTAIESGEMLRHIQDCAHVPAVYIFTDLNVFFPGNVHRYVNGLGIRRLLAALLAGDKNTRIIATSSHDPADAEFENDNELAAAIVHRLGAPTMSELTSFVPEQLVADASAAVARCETSRGVQPGEQLYVSGPILQAAAGAMTILSAVDPDLVTLVCEHSHLSGRRPVNKPDEEVAFYLGLWRKLKDALNSDVLRCLYLLAASDDGMTIASLQIAIEDWQAFQPLASPLKPDVLIATLDDLCKRTNERLLHKSPTSRLAEAERSARERRAPLDLLLQYQIDPPMQRGLSDALLVFAPEDFRNAHLLVACRARARSKTLKHSLPHQHGARLSDVRRDIQSYTCQLAAQIDVDTPTGRDGAANCCETEAFRPGSRASAIAAIRYAYHHVMKNEIDRDNRLTMNLDEDHLRLDLLLCLFAGVGRRYWGAARDQKLPSAIPSYLHQAFSYAQLAEILVGVAITSHFCNRPDITVWAGARARTLLPEALPQGVVLQQSEMDAVRASFVRIQCVEADNTLLGGPTPGEDRAAQLRAVEQSILSETLEIVEKIHNEAVRDKARQRCLQRQFQLMAAKAVPNIGAMKIMLETVLAIHRRALERSNHEAGTLAGKPAITFMRMLFGDPVLEEPLWKQIGWTQTEALRNFDDLLALATSRLSRFSGAERAQVAMCQAMRDAIAGDFESAVWSRDLAQDRLQFPAGSLGFQAGLLWASAQISFMAAGAEKERGRRNELLDDCWQNVTLLRDQSERCHFLGYEAKAALLMGRVHQIGLLRRGGAKHYGDVAVTKACLKKMIDNAEATGTDRFVSTAREQLAKL